MADFTGWPEAMVPVTTLQLDPGNPRIPSGGAPLPQRALIAELVEHDNVYDLARAIADQGYYPLESMIALKDDGKTIVLEGNRRLAALKLLINPDLAPPSFLNRFRKLAENGATPGTAKVRVLHAPTREAAAPLILRKHTRDQVQRWSPLMQARFYRTLAATGASLEAMADQYATTAGDIARFLRTDAMYGAACSIELPDDVRKVVHDPRRFPAAVLERLLDIPQTKTFLGIDFDRKGRLQGKVHPEEFVKGYSRILSDIARERINTRKLNKAKDARDYLAGLKNDEPNKRRPGSFTSADLESGGRSSKNAPSNAPGPTQRPRVVRLGNSVVPPGTTCPIAHPRIREVFHELKRLPVDNRGFPNASAVLLRVLLEIALANYLASTGKDAPLREKIQKKKGAQASTWCWTLSQMLGVVVQDTTIPLRQQERKAIQQMRDKADSILTVDDLDRFVHSPYATPDWRQLRGYWETLKTLFELILQDPPQPTATRPPKP